MGPDDFFHEVPGDPWGDVPTWVVDERLLNTLRQGPPDGTDDLSAAIGLTHLVHDDLECFGTNGGERLSNDQMALALRTLRAVLERVGIALDIPWRDYTTFRNHWIKKDCANSYQARRDLLAELFEPIHARLTAMEDQALESVLANPVTPHQSTGWPKVDQEIRELRRRFRSSTTPQDYRAVGTHCVGVIEAISRTVYDPEKHLREGEAEPPPDKTKLRLDRYIEHALGGADNEEVRGVARKTIELAHKVKHRETPTRRDAGIAADSVILLANILRRCEQEF